MPIYSYKCAQCGFEDDILISHAASQTMSTQCPQCKTPGVFSRTISTNTNFHLKGGGWYRGSSPEK
jgi:putative FmdB family regulatory protein